MSTSTLVAYGAEPRGASVELASEPCRPSAAFAEHITAVTVGTMTLAEREGAVTVPAVSGGCFCGHPASDHESRKRGDINGLWCNSCQLWCT